MKLTFKKELDFFTLKLVAVMQQLLTRTTCDLQNERMDR